MRLRNISEHINDVKAILDFYEPDREEVVAVEIITTRTVLVKVKPGEQLAVVVSKNLPEIVKERADINLNCLGDIPPWLDPESDPVFEA